MKRWKCIIQYDGSMFYGFQIQRNKRTVQGEIEKVLTRMNKGKHVRITASGRTDSGVHAVGQVFHFDTAAANLSASDWKKALNAQLPEDIFIKDVQEVSTDFHARYNVKEKEYRYYVQHTKEIDIFRRKYVYHFPYHLNMEKILLGCSLLEGTHDFTTFSSPKATVKGDKVRTIYEATCKQEGKDIIFIFRGSGFLYNMVRIMVGVLLDIGQGKFEPEDIPLLLEKKNRQLVGKTIDSHGLYLWNVKYDDPKSNS